MADLAPILESILATAAAGDADRLAAATARGLLEACRPTAVRTYVGSVEAVAGAPDRQGTWHAVRGADGVRGELLDPASPSSADVVLNVAATAFALLLERRRARDLARAARECAHDVRNRLNALQLQLLVLSQLANAPAPVPAGVVVERARRALVAAGALLPALERLEDLVGTEMNIRPGGAPPTVR